MPSLIESATDIIPANLHNKNVSKIASKFMNLCV